jgi:HNH endonuclease/NUMOD4 motif
MEEQWRVIPEYSSYEASSQGNIRNAKTKKVLSPFKVPDGYSQVRLSLGSRKDYKVCRVHRLVAAAWIVNPGGKETVNHKNTNKHDNRVENLEWCSHQEQSLHYVATLAQQGITRAPKAFDTNIEDYEGEVWKVIPSIPTYQASSRGRIKNPQGNILLGHHKSTYIQMRIVGKKHIYVHRVIAETFCENFSEQCVVNHKDGNKKNNIASNLECITQGENVLHAYNTNANKKRIPIKQYNLDGTFVAEFVSFLDAARKTGFNDSSIRWGIRYAEGKHGGFIWKM